MRFFCPSACAGLIFPVNFTPVGTILSHPVMLLVYCSHITNRTRYALGLVLETLLGLEWRATSLEEEFRQYGGPRIQYAGKPLDAGGVFVLASGILSERAVRSFQPGVTWKDGLPLLFPSPESACGIGFDVFSAAFYLVSRYEEYLPFRKDRFGRFEALESFSFRHGFLHIPVVDRYALLLARALKREFPRLDFPDRSFRQIPTIDVDVAYAYRGRGLVRTAYGTMGSLLRGDLSAVRRRFQVLAGKARDPYDTYDLQLRLHRRYGLKPHYFFLCGDYGPYDRNISFFSATFQNLVKKISDYAVTGLHPSFEASDHPEGLETEVRRLSRLLNREVRFSRHHFLRISLPGSYRELIRLNIGHDFSMGYASRPGFRAGTCTPFHFYDLGEESITSLKVYPVSIMDGTLRDYMGLSPDQAIQQIGSLMKGVRDVGGTWISLWHNDSLSDEGRWAGWLRVYESMLELGETIKRESP